MFQKHNLMLSVSTIALITVLIGSCSKKPTKPDSEDFSTVIASGGQFEAVIEAADTTAPEVSVDSSGGEIYYCTKRTVNLTEAPSEYCTFDVSSTIIFPGNLLQGNSLTNATPTPIPLLRGPGTIVMTVMNGASNVSRTVDTISLSSVYTASNQILAENPGNLAAHQTYTMKQISSQEELGLELNVKYSNLATDVKGSFKYKSDISYTRYLVKLQQMYYTMAYQLPTSTTEIFHASVKASDLAKYVYPGNPGAFISSVSYGRIFYLLIQSTSSRQEVEASVKASFDYGVHNTQIGVGVKYVSELDELEIGGFAIGGDANLAFGALRGDPEALKAYIDSGGTVTTGKALSYVVNSLASPEQIVSVGISTEFDIVNCVPVAESIENPLCWYRADQGVIAEYCQISVYDMVTKLENLFGNHDNDAVGEAKYDYQWGGRLKGSTGYPYIQLFDNYTGSETGGCSGSISGKFNLNPIMLENTDLTVVMIWEVSRPFGGGINVTPIRCGRTDPYRSLWVAWYNNPFLGDSISIYDSRSYGPTPPPVASGPYDPDGIEMTTVIVSGTDGISIYDERRLVCTAPGTHDYLDNLDWASFSVHALLTDVGRDQIKFHEYRIYGSAINADQLDALYIEMRNRYDL